MAVNSLTLYLPGSSVPIQVWEGSQMHAVYVSMGANSIPSAPGETVRQDPFPQYVDDAEVAALDTRVDAIEATLPGKVSSTSLAGVEVLTYAAYGALTPDAGTLYLIQGADSAVAALGHGDSPLVWLTDLLIEGNFQSYADDPYNAFTGMWGHYLPQNDTLQAESTMRVSPATFPDGTTFTWDVTPDPDWAGVNGFLHVSYGNYDDSPGTIPSRQVYTITDLAVTIDWTFAGDAGSGLLAECWLTPTSQPSGSPTRQYEVAFFPKLSPAAISYVNSLPTVGAGSFVDSNAVTWNVREGVSGTAQPYYIAYRPGYVAFTGPLPFDDFFAFLIASAKISGNEWFNGLAFGVEPHSGAGSLTVTDFSAAYTGAARVPWTISNLSATAQSSTTVLLGWTPAAGAASHQYRVNGGTWTATSAAGSHTVTGLTAGTEYTFEVRPVNATGNGAQSNTASATTTSAGTTNLITNGGFADDTGWNGFWFSGKAVTGGKAVFTASPAYDDINQPVTLVAGKYYELTWTVSDRTSGTVFPVLSGGTNRNGTLRSANGTFTERLLANTGNDTFRFMLDTGGTLSVDNISLVGPYNTATVGGA